MKKAKYTEIFNSVQGEGSRTGKLCSWVRFFSCNLTCNGFGQKDPTDPSTHILPYQTINIDNIKKIEDLPLFEYGCDTSHSWSARYKHLAMEKTPEDLADAVRELLIGKSFTHPTSGQDIEHVFTGGEPMMQQEAMIGIVEKWIADNDFPQYITIETNGTRALTPEFEEAIYRWYDQNNIQIVFSVSQKLFNVSGELPKKAFKPEVIQQYNNVASNTNADTLCQLKYVLNDSDAAWTELRKNVDTLTTDYGVMWDVWIMPVGASYDEQTKSNVIGKIADRAIAEGYHVSGRMHVVLWGNDQHGR